MKTLFLRPLITEKSMAKAAAGVYQFMVPTWATKQSIAERVGERFGVTVITVNTATMRQEPVVFKRRPGTRSAYKKATVTLKTGESLADFSLPAESNQAAPSNEASVESATTPAESTITVRSKKKRGGE